MKKIDEVKPANMGPYTDSLGKHGPGEYAAWIVQLMMLQPKEINARNRHTIKIIKQLSSDSKARGKVHKSIQKMVKTALVSPKWEGRLSVSEANNATRQQFIEAIARHPKLKFCVQFQPLTPSVNLAATADLKIRKMAVYPESETEAKQLLVELLLSNL